MWTRKSMLQNILRNAGEHFSYSAIMRKLRKEQPKLVEEFMKCFQLAFQDAISSDIQDPEKVALMQTVKQLHI